MAFKSFDSRADWFVDPSLVDLKIRKRLIPTISGESSLRYFDGATMLSYMYPSKTSETVFCRRSSKPAICEAGHGFDPERRNLPLSILEVKQSSLGEYAGRGVFAKEDIPHLSYVGLDKSIHIVYMNPSTYDIIVGMEKHWTSEDFFGEVLEIYTHGYGHSFSHHVSFFVTFLFLRLRLLTLDHCLFSFSRRAVSTFSLTQLYNVLSIMVVTDRTALVTISTSLRQQQILQICLRKSFVSIPEKRIYTILLPNDRPISFHARYLFAISLLERSSLTTILE